MKQYLNDYHDGIILKYNNRYNICEYEKKECFDLIGSDDAIGKPITCGVLRTYSNCDVVEWQNNMDIDALIADKQRIKCISCNKEYEQPSKQDDDAKGNEDSDDCYWIEGTAKKT